MVPAVVLAGGEGTRLRPLTERTPKPLLPLLDRPVIARVLDELGRNGVRRAILACSYRAELVERALRSSYAGIQLEYSVEPQPLGTAGAVRHAAASLDATFLAVNADSLWRLDLAGMLAVHAARRAAATIALTRAADAAAFGLVETDGDRITRFLEKPSPRKDALVSAGVYLLEPSVLDSVPAGRAASLERELFPALAAQGRLHASTIAGGFVDVGTIESYLRAHWSLLDGGVGTRRLDAASARIDPEARVVPPVFVGDGVVIAAGARVGPRTALYERSEVASGAVVEASVVGRGAHVGSHAVVSGSIVGDDARLGSSCEVRGFAVVGAGRKLPGGSVVDGSSGSAQPATA